ncbi:MAG: C40 family peptidase [Candidatus Omnitrophica bacterium]|nr:C40 family peptidase [Candidatus Omnitrophota bacterium]
MPRLFLFGLVLALGAAPASAAPAENATARIAVPVADLRKEPAASTGSLAHDPLEESQLLYGDRVEVLERKNGWARVSAAEQLEWTHGHRWEGYPGWIEESALELAPPPSWKPNLVVTAKWAAARAGPEPRGPALLTLSIGTRLMGIEAVRGWWKLRLLTGATGWIQAREAAPLEETADPAALRARLVRTARLFIGDPYLWGGRSARAVDCSGLAGLVYQANGLSVPRDAHEQWMKARPIAMESLQAGDLVFLHDPKDIERVSHVMLYAGGGQLIEGPGTGRAVREIGLKERLRLEPDRQASFGSYLP